MQKPFRQQNRLPKRRAGNLHVSRYRQLKNDILPESTQKQDWCSEKSHQATVPFHRLSSPTDRHNQLSETKMSARATPSELSHESDKKFHQH
ncbi:hypothetical protein RRG08_022994 [Elysia crispata]|uniref:Uncharacterized protein n=1 Tax=Elysia crispata TaxID=231223 RepID=A0AAE1DYL8_9GAST|nr:hypothetical protein RRG08_022994 [Elysia crispata]